MTEQKKRGRPPKSDTIPTAVIEAMSAEQVAVVEDTSAAQDMADRIWAGQSESLSRHERLGRIAAALEAQGLSMEGVKLS